MSIEMNCHIDKKRIIKNYKSINNKYALQSIHGRDSHGEYKEVIDLANGEALIFKELKLERNNDKFQYENSFRKKFQSIMTIFSDFRHKNVLPYRSSQISEYHLGCTLYEHRNIFASLNDVLYDINKDNMYKNRLTPRKTALIMSQLLEGAEYIHSNNLVHMDINLNNILCNADISQVYLTNFRAEQILMEGYGVISLGEYENYYQFQAPEFREIIKANDSSARIDIFSLGVCMYYLLTNKYPFDGGNTIETLINIHSNFVPKPPHKIEELKEKVPQDLSTVCLKAIKTNPHERYETAKCFLKDLYETKLLTNSLGSITSNNTSNNEFTLEELYSLALLSHCVDDINNPNWFWNVKKKYGTSESMVDISGLDILENIYHTNSLDTISSEIMKKKKHFASKLIHDKTNYRTIIDTEVSYFEFIEAGIELDISTTEEFNKLVLNNQVTELLYLYLIKNYTHPESMNNLGSLYQEYDKYQKSIEYYEASSELKNIKALNNLGTLYMHGFGVQTNIGKAFEYFFQSAESGNANAHFNIALLHEYKENFEEAEQSYLKAFEMGSKASAFRLGGLYEYQNNIEEAKIWYKRSAKLDDANGMFKLAALNDKQLNYESLDIIMYHYYKKAAYHGNIDAMIRLSMLYDHFKEIPTKENNYTSNSSHFTSYILEFKETEISSRFPSVSRQPAYMKYINETYYPFYTNNLKMAMRYSDNYKQVKIHVAGEYAKHFEHKQDGRLRIIKQEKSTKEEEIAIAAFQQYRNVAELGDSKGMVNLGLMYANGHGVEQDDSKAAKWYRRAAAKGNSSGMFNLGLMYANGRGIKQDDNEAMKWYRKAAKAGDSKAMVNLGFMYSRGYGVKQDKSEAVEWFRKSAQMGDSGAMVNLGLMYSRGYGIKQDYNEALKWFRKSAQMGNSGAMVNSHFIYSRDYGIKQDYNEALKWYRKSAEMGNSGAMVNLGFIYSQGYGIEKDYNKAKELFEQAVELGNSSAMINLAWMYYNGYGVEKDYIKAIKLYKQAAQMGNSGAMVNADFLSMSIDDEVEENHNEALEFALYIKIDTYKFYDEPKKDNIVVIYQEID